MQDPRARIFFIATFSSHARDIICAVRTSIWLTTSHIVQVQYIVVIVHRLSACVTMFKIMLVSFPSTHVAPFCCAWANKPETAVQSSTFFSLGITWCNTIMGIHVEKPCDAKRKKMGALELWTAVSALISRHVCLVNCEDKGQLVLYVCHPAQTSVVRGEICL